MAQVIEEYLYSLKPVIDNKAFEAASGSIEKILQKTSRNFEKYKGAKLDLAQKQKDLAETQSMIKALNDLAKQTGQEKYAIRAKELKDDESTGTKKLQSEIDTLNMDIDAMNKSMGVVGKAAGGFSSALLSGAGKAVAVVGLFQEVIDQANKIIETSKQYSNQFISSGSVFVDSGTRDTMAKYGLNSTQAQGMNTAMGVLNISSSDMGRLTAGQKESMQKLMDVYQKGLDSIDPEKLERFNEGVQQYQYLQAEFQVKLKTAVMQLLAESDTLPKLLDHMEEFMEQVVDLLSSDAAQFAFDTFIGFLNSIMHIINGIGSVFGLGGGSSTTNNNSKTSNAVYNIYGNNYSNNNDLVKDIALQQQKALEG